MGSDYPLKTFFFLKIKNQIQDEFHSWKIKRRPVSHVFLVVHLFVWQDIVWAPDSDVSVSHQHNATQHNTIPRRYLDQHSLIKSSCVPLQRELEDPEKVLEVGDSAA